METKSMIEMATQIAIGIPVDDIQVLVDQYSRLDTIGPIFDPTAYMAVMGTKRGHERLARAFLAFPPGGRQDSGGGQQVSGQPHFVIDTSALFNLLRRRFENGAFVTDFGPAFAPQPDAEVIDVEGRVVDTPIALPEGNE